MARVRVKFDGNVFVPCEPVKMPAGSMFNIFIPEPPRELTPEEWQWWLELHDELEANPPPFATVDDYLRYRRMG